MDSPQSNMHCLRISQRYAKFIREVQQFYVKACLSVLLKLSERLNIEEDSITMLTSRFSLFVPSENNSKLLLDYQSVKKTELPIMESHDDQSQKRNDRYWLEVSLMKDAAIEKPRFTNLSTLARFMVLIPHSNSFCEGVISIVTDSRYNLGKDVIKGYAYSSAYAGKTIIRSNPVGLLITKINLFKQQKINCCE